MTLTPAQIFWIFALPCLLLAVGLILAWRPWNRLSTIDGRWAAAPLICAGFAIAFWHVRGSPAPGNVLYWIFYFTIPIAALGLIDALLHPPLWLRAIILLLLWRIAVRLLLAPLIPRQMTQNEAELWIDAAALLMLVWWLTFENLADRVAGIAVPLLLTILCAGIAVMLATTWLVQQWATLAGMLATISLTATAITFWKRKISLGRGGVMAIVLLLQSLMIHAHFYGNSDLTTAQEWRIILLLASPLLAFAGDLPGIRSMRPSLRLVVRVLPVLIAVGIVAGYAVHDFQVASQQQSMAGEE